MSSALQRLRKLREKQPDIPDYWQEDYEERAAILEYDGGLDRESAQRQARIEIQKMLQERTNGGNSQNERQS